MSPGCTVMANSLTCLKRLSLAVHNARPSQPRLQAQATPADVLSNSSWSCRRAQVWLGYQQSLRPCESGLTLNVDLAATAFLQVQARQPSGDVSKVIHKLATLHLPRTVAI